MSKEKKHALSGDEGLIPELRFPDFVNDGEWEDGELGDHCEITTGKLDANAMVANGQYRFYTCAKDYYYIDNYAFDTDALLISGNGAHVGYIHHYNGKFNAYQRTYVLDNFDKDIHYVQYFLERNLKARIASEKKDGNTPYIVRSTLTEMQLLYPKNEDEQQKIASCLSSLDELIAAHNDKLDALKDHKKGLLQNLFPQEGETIPKVRFPEFEGDGEWVEKELSEVSKIITGSTPSTKVPEYYGGDIMFVSPADISNNKYVESTEKTLTVAGFEKTRKIKSNSVMFVCIGSTIGKVAMNKFDCATNQQINSLVPDNENSSDFLYSNLELNASNISGIAGNQAVPIINKTLFSSVKLKFPPSIQEQKKIATCLSAVDELLTAQQEKIDELQEHKKGLMQGLFPKSITN